MANPLREPRVSVAYFFSPSKADILCGPLPELVSPQKPAIYRQFTFSDFMQRYFMGELQGKTVTNYFKVSNVEVPALDKQGETYIS